MTVGKEIKVILTLDDAGFSTKSKSAREVVQALDFSLKDIRKSAAGFESGIGAMVKEVSSIAPAVQGVERILQAVQKELSSTVDKLTGIASQARGAKGDLRELDSTLSPLQRTLSLVGRGAGDAGVSIAQMKPSLAAAAAGFRDLTKAQTDNAKAAKESATTAIEARQRQLRNDIESNTATLTARERLYDQLIAAENNFNRRSMEQQLIAENIRRSKKAATITGADGTQIRTTNGAAAAMNEADRYATSAANIRAQLTALDALLPKMREEQAQRQAEISMLDKERAAVLANIEAKKTMQSIADYVGKSNAQEIERIARQRVSADKAANTERAASDRELANQRMRYAREVAEEERRQADAIVSMWKGMAQMWTAAKIEKGLAASVGAADQMQRERTMVSTLGLSSKDEAQFFASSDRLAKNLQFISQLDAIKSRMSAIASLGENNAAVIDATLENALKATNNLQYLGLAHGDTQSTLRNLYGVTEMRQQTASPEAMNRTFDTLQKITTATAGKVQIQDIETVLRRFGGGASQLSDQGLISLSALVDQFKVSGGDQGGSGGGVSSVGTMMKMFQAYAMGKSLSNNAVSELHESGVLNESATAGTAPQGLMKSLKNAGFKNIDEWMSNPVAAMQKLFPAFVDFAKRHQKDFFDAGANVDDETSQANAVMRVLQRMGITQTAIQGFMSAAAPRAAHRLNAQVDTINNAKGVDDVNKELGDQFGQQWAITKATLTDIATIVGNSLLPTMTDLLKMVNGILASFRSFGTDNPALTQFLAISAGVGSLALGLSGLLNLFGAGGITGAIATLGTAAATAFPTFTALLARLGGMVETLMPGFGSFLAFLARGAVWIGSAAFAGIIGWAIGTWVKDITVGGLTVQQHMTNLMLGIEIALRSGIASMMEKWHAFKAALGMGGATDSAEDAERRAEIKALQDMKYTPATGTDASGRLNAANDPRVAAMQKAMASSESHGALSTLANSYTPNSPLAAKRERGEHTDPLNKALGEAQARMDSAQIKLASLKAGAETLDDLWQQAAAEVEGKRVAGDYNPDHDKNRTPAANDPRIQQLVQRTYETKLLAEQTKGLTFANERLVAANADAEAAMDRLTDGGAAKQSDAFRALEREMARAEIRLGAGTRAFYAWNIAKNSALFERSRADMGNFAAGMIDSNRADAAKFLPTDQLRVMAELDAAEKKQRDQYAVLAETLRSSTEKTIAAYEAQLAGFKGTETQREAFAREIQTNIDAVREEARDTEMRAEVEQTARLRIQAEQRQRALEQPIEALAREWKDSFKTLEGYQNSWANGFVDMLTSNLGKGRMEVGKFVQGILLDIANAKIKEQLADPLKDAITAGTNVLMGSLFKKPGAQPEAEGQATEKTVLDAMSREAAGAGKALSDMAKGGVEDAAVATAQSAVQATRGATVQEVFSSTISQATAALQEFIMALQTSGGGGGGGGILGQILGGGQGVWAGSGDYGALGDMGNMGADFVIPGFANGGIMTSSGPVPLRKYAGGGVANSPQLAMYGEAGPEAYVPLPDGRSIPVTMQGASGAAPAVTVNVINQSGQNVDGQQGQAKFDGKQYVLDVVLTAANSPGRFRDGMRSAVK